MCEDAMEVVGDFGFEFGGRGFGALGELGGVVGGETEKGGWWRVGEIISWGGGCYCAGHTPAVEF
jgi:hypothetical protein